MLLIVYHNQERRIFCPIPFTLTSGLTKRHWVISGYPERERTNAVCWAVCRAYEESRFEERAREILREELQNVRFVSSETQSEARESQEIAVDGEISDFLSALQSGRLDM